MKLVQNKDTTIFFPTPLGLVTLMGAVSSAKIQIVAWSFVQNKTIGP
jgi:hypothetical protein